MRSQFSLYRSLMVAISCFVMQPQPDAKAEEGMLLRFGKNAQALHLPVGSRAVRIVPAFEDYAFMLEDACSAMNLKDKDCLIYPMNGEIGLNAIATKFDGNRLIVYGRELSPIVGYDGALGIMAHELGHHICGHLEQKTSDPHRDELVADQFAGAVLRKRGISAEMARSMAKALDDRPSLSHPARPIRELAIMAGWQRPELGRSCKLAESVR